MTKVILASGSPTRKRVLESLGVAFEAVASGVDEKAIRDDDPLALAEKLSREKALAVSSRFPDAVVIAADCFVVFQGKIFEKPASKEQAASFLESFSGKALQVVTGLAVARGSDGKLRSCAESCEVKFRALPKEEILSYVDRHPVTTFAGAFDSEGVLRFAERVNGNPHFTAGMPVNRLLEFLREFDVRS